MERIAGNAETGADVFLAQQRIRRYPAAELAGQLARMLYICFRHQNDKFVSAIAGHNVGAPAIGLQDLPDALEHEVAFEVPVEIVHKLEAVEVHEHERKGASGASGAFPFRGQGFHEKAMSLDAGEAVGD